VRFEKDGGNSFDLSKKRGGIHFRQFLNLGGKERGKKKKKRISLSRHLLIRGKREGGGETTFGERLRTRWNTLLMGRGKGKKKGKGGIELWRGY